MFTLCSHSIALPFLAMPVWFKENVLIFLQIYDIMFIFASHCRL